MNKVGEWERDLQSGNLGFSLIETVIALAVIAVTFIGLIGLLGLGAADDQVSSQQTAANGIASSIFADLRSTPGNVAGSGTYSVSPSSPRFSLTMPTVDTISPSPLGAVTPITLYFDNSPILVPAGSPSAVYKVSVYLVQLSHIGQGSGGHGFSQYTDMARVVVSWPAQASTVPSGSVDVISQFLVH